MLYLTISIYIKIICIIIIEWISVNSLVVSNLFNNKNEEVVQRDKGNNKSKNQNKKQRQSKPLLLVIEDPSIEMEYRMFREICLDELIFVNLEYLHDRI